MDQITKPVATTTTNITTPKPLTPSASIAQTVSQQPRALAVPGVQKEAEKKTVQADGAFRVIPTEEISAIYNELIDASNKRKNFYYSKRDAIIALLKEFHKNSGGKIYSLSELAEDITKTNKFGAVSRQYLSGLWSQVCKELGKPAGKNKITKGNNN